MLPSRLSLTPNSTTYSASYLDVNMVRDHAGVLEMLLGNHYLLTREGLMVSSEKRIHTADKRLEISTLHQRLIATSKKNGKRLTVLQ
jgi:hypothetical protein